MNNLNIHDIKSLTQIPDYSFFIFISLIIVALMIVIVLIYFIYKTFKNRDFKRRNSFEILKNIDLNDAKKSAYLITQHSRILVSNEKEEKLLNELIESLYQYKYKKNVSSINEESQQKFKTFMDLLNVK